MEDSNFTYEEAILNGRFTNSKVITDLVGKTNQYGERRDIEALLKAQMAAKIVRYVEDCDETVAKGISLGIELGGPIYGKVGEDFLKEKNPEYKKSALGIALTKVMLSGLSGEKVDKILEGVASVLEGEQNISEEAKAAKIAYMIYNGANKYKNRDDFNSTSTIALGKVLRKTKENGTVSSIDFLRTINEMDSEKDLVVRNPQRKEELEKAFSYYVENYSEIPEEFLIALEGYSKESIVGYYVVSMREDELGMIPESKMNDNRINEI